MGTKKHTTAPKTDDGCRANAGSGKQSFQRVRSQAGARERVAQVALLQRTNYLKSVAGSAAHSFRTANAPLMVHIKNVRQKTSNTR